MKVLLIHIRPHVQLPGLIQELTNVTDDNDEFAELVEDQYLKSLKASLFFPTAPAWTDD